MSEHRKVFAAKGRKRSWILGYLLVVVWLYGYDCGLVVRFRFGSAKEGCYCEGREEFDEKWICAVLPLQLVTFGKCVALGAVVCMVTRCCIATCPCPAVGSEVEF